MVGNLVRGFEARFPWLSSWFGDRLDIELPAFLVSLTVHGLLLVSLAFAGYSVHQEAQRREFNSEVVTDNLVTSESTFQDLDQSNTPPPLEAAAGSFAPTLATTITAAPASAGATACFDSVDRYKPWHRTGVSQARCQASNRGRCSNGDDARADSFDSGQWSRNGWWRRRGRRSDCDRDRTPA